MCIRDRGRNASKASVAKHASPEEYRASTGFECLLGWLYPVSYTHLDVGATLTNQDVAGQNELTVCTLGAQKLNIITYRAKKHSARRMGHRQPFTKVEITAING